jgi:hypothetical protein
MQAATLKMIENADPDGTVYTPKSQHEFICRRPPEWRNLSKLGPSRPPTLKPTVQEIVRSGRIEIVEGRASEEEIERTRLNAAS